MHGEVETISDRISSLDMAIQYRLLELKAKGGKEVLDCLMEDYSELTGMLEAINVITY